MFAEGGPSESLEFGAWRGQGIRSATLFPPAGSWNALENPPPVVTAWRNHPQVRVVLSYPLWANSMLSGSLAAAAAGTYDSHYAALADHLVHDGLSHAILRLGWEFNGTWYPWSARTASDARDYRNAWRRIVSAMRGTRGEHFGFDWTSVGYPAGLNPGLAYPGDRYVTEIGQDVYDTCFRPRCDAAQRWHSLVHRRYGMAWHVRFAARHHKPLSFPEWGLTSNLLDPGRSGGDDPGFVRHMHRWFAAHDVVLENYFNADTVWGNHSMTGPLGSFRSAAQLYRRLF